MCIESRAAYGDVQTHSGVVWKAFCSVSNTEGASVTSTRSVTLTPLSTLNFEVGHTYDIVIGSISPRNPSMSNVSTYNVRSYSASLTSMALYTPGNNLYWNLTLGGSAHLTYQCETTGNFTIKYTTSTTCSYDTSKDTWWFNCYLGLGIYDITVTDITPRTEKEVLEDIEKVDKEQLEQQKEQTETQKGIFASIKDFFGSFFQNLIDSVIGLFVPSSDEMSDLFGQLNDFFSDTFGFLYAPFDYLIQLIGVFTSSSGTTGLTLPGFSIMGHEVWGDQTYDIASDPVAGKVLEYVRMGTGVLLAGWFIMYLQDFFKERFGKG